MDHDPERPGPGMLCTCPIGRELERRLDAARAEGRLAKLEDTTPCEQVVQLQTTAAEKRKDLLAKGWIDPGSPR